MTNLYKHQKRSYNTITYVRIYTDYINNPHIYIDEPLLSKTTINSILDKCTNNAYQTYKITQLLVNKTLVSSTKPAHFSKIKHI
jgi:hypothetical protein